ncbi:hypothetical protein BD324DRAFT_652025 [Kockovaella imperatae]|uniref:Zinc finger Mcm10/DnaG-type domain-containing protein n=1 Tax=Kockovaella imperatae TaxID=4999 RepID=A0A1Y1UDP1_9TREE|nr:hypothetical protein BD324DRAFT_652025 [Kockovaella imperatae]ORX36122.1 hypothetical protein BD324DRAFT_652025 [Kockovaella imperatae]
MDVDTADLDAQIAALQAEKARKLRLADQSRRAREQEEAKVLIGSTPTKPATKTNTCDPPPQPRFNVTRVSRESLPSVPVAGPSKLSSSLASLRQKGSSLSRNDAPKVARSSSFYTDTLPRQPNQSRSDLKGKSRSPSPVPQRDEDSLTIVNRLQLGPRRFGKDPEGEDVWEHVEPNSGIRLSKRLLSHEILQDQLRGRYFLPPSLLYSVIRLSRDGATYDVPVEGDWVTIAIVAERSQVRVSGAKEGPGSDSDDDAKQGDKEKSRVQKDKSKWQKRRGPRKYVNLKLVSLPSRAASIGKSVGQMGDALLQLLLFESDSKVHDKDDGESQFRYQGGSGGAYEKWCNLTEGTVIAVLNPRVLRPLRSGTQAPHPLTLPLALNPMSADSITVIGQARDLGRCSAEQKDGNRCRTWVDLRQSQVCEYHIHAAVSRSRAGRAEFTASTSGFDLTTMPFANARRVQGLNGKKSGLLPNRGAQTGQGDAGATYVVGGNAIHTRSDGGLRSFGNEHLSEKLGRGRAERRKRRLEEQDAEEAISKLLKEDKNGSTGAKYLAKLGKSVTQAKESVEDRKRPFGVHAVRRIGFDPTLKAGQRDDEDHAKRMESLISLKDPDRPIRLGRPAGTSKSNIRPPTLAPDPVTDEDMVDLD